jgi:hypothetical protein
MQGGNASQFFWAALATIIGTDGKKYDDLFRAGAGEESTVCWGDYGMADCTGQSEFFDNLKKATSR